MFEHFVINEIYRLNKYTESGYRLSYLLSEGGLEIDLILERPREPSVYIEIKAATQVEDRHLKHLLRLQQDNVAGRYICISRETHARRVLGVEVMPWREALKALGLV